MTTRKSKKKDRDLHGILSHGNGKPTNWMLVRTGVSHGQNRGETFWEIAKEQWGLEKPKMIISVIGSGQSLILRNVFKLVCSIWCSKIKVKFEQSFEIESKSKSPRKIWPRAYKCGFINTSLGDNFWYWSWYCERGWRCC